MGFPFFRLRSQEGAVIQMGGVLSHTLEVYWSPRPAGVGVSETLSVAPPAEPRGEKKHFLCKFWAVKNF